MICCRVTPAQKGAVVKLVKQRKRMTLAIGDGGNDVAMIQEAHVGVGISGKEGLQAARAADYAIGRFRFLQRLLLVHGRYSYKRTALVAQYAFYRSFYISFIQLLFNIYAGFSCASFFHSIPLSGWSIITIPASISLTLDKDALDMPTSALTRRARPRRRSPWLLSRDGACRAGRRQRSFFSAVLRHRVHAPAGRLRHRPRDDRQGATISLMIVIATSSTTRCTDGTTRSICWVCCCISSCTRWAPSCTSRGSTSTCSTARCNASPPTSCSSPSAAHDHGSRRPARSRAEGGQVSVARPHQAVQLYERRRKTAENVNPIGLLERASSGRRRGPAG